MTAFELTNTPDELISQKPVIQAHRIDVYSNFKSKEERQKNKLERIKKRASSKEKNESKSASFDGDYNDNTPYHPHRIAGVLYQLYATKPIVEPLSNFDANEIDLGIDGMDLSEMRSNKDCNACS